MPQSLEGVGGGAGLECAPSQKVQSFVGDGNRNGGSLGITFNSARAGNDGESAAADCFSGDTYRG
jgi:hypothetical protein